MSRIIGRPVYPSTLQASGIWDAKEQSEYKRAGNWPLTKDLYWSNVTLLLHGNGANNSTTFTDSSLSNLSITTTGTPVISTIQSKLGGASMYFNATSEYLNIPSDYSSVEFGTGDFTIEFWSYLQSAVTEYQFLINVSHANGNLDVRYGNGGFGNKLQVGVNTNTLSTTWSCALTKAGDVGSWKHMAFTRSGTTCRFFVNGVVQNINNGANPSSYPSTSFTSSVNVTGIVSASIGGANTHTSSVYLDEFRITKGVARYTGNFTPQTTEYVEL
jgi:hypothetical protein